MISYRNIIPDELYNELLYIRDTETGFAWRVGDIANMLIDLHRDSKNVGAMEVYAAVASVYGKSARTVRDYAAVAKRVPGWERNKPEYDVLAFAHFREAAKDGNDMEEVLDYALSKVEEYGRPASVDDVKEHFGDGIEIELSSVGNLTRDQHIDVGLRGAVSCLKEAAPFIGERGSEAATLLNEIIVSIGKLEKLLANMVEVV